MNTAALAHSGDRCARRRRGARESRRSISLLEKDKRSRGLASSGLEGRGRGPAARQPRRLTRRRTA